MRNRQGMTIFVKRGGKTYQVCECGPRCSFARKDGDADLTTSVGSKWDRTHCNRGRCYLPKWWLYSTVGNALGHALHEMKKGGAK